MNLLALRKRARQIMMVGALGILAGGAMMFGGEMQFGDGVLIAGVVLFVVGVILLAQTPTGDVVSDDANKGDAG